jgi:hypothetical protein
MNLYNPFRGQGFKHSSLTREQIRTIARMNDIPRGRNTRDTLNNLRSAGIQLPAQMP